MAAVLAILRLLSRHDTVRCCDETDIFLLHLKAGFLEDFASSTFLKCFPGFQMPTR